MKKRLLAGLIAMIAAISLTGCGDNLNDGTAYSGLTREQVIQICDNLITQLDDKEAEYDNLYALYNGIQSESKPTTAIGITGDGTGRFTFNSFENKIIFPTHLEYPNSEFAIANGNISIVQGITITPSSNWIMKMNGTSIELEHPNGVSGTIKVAVQHYVYTPEQLQEQVYKEWFEQLPASNITYTNISIGGGRFGCQAASPTLIDGENAFIRCGLFASGDYCVEYTFVYRGNQDITKDESITSLLNTIKMNGQNVIIEQ